MSTSSPAKSMSLSSSPTATRMFASAAADDLAESCGFVSSERPEAPFVFTCSSGKLGLA